MFEEGSLKDQKLSMKNLTTCPKIKQHHIQHICWLPENTRSDILDSVINKELSLAQMKERADKTSHYETVKQAFVRCTNSKSCADAENSFPEYTVNINHFMSMNFRGDFPEAFQAFCQSALRSKTTSSNPSHQDMQSFLH